MEVTREELQEWYNTMKMKDLMERLGYRNPASLYGLLKKAGIPLKTGYNRLKRNTVKLV